MTDSNHSIDRVVQNIKDVVDARDSARTALLCTSMVALGVALGVNLYTAKMLATLDLATYYSGNASVEALNSFYRTLMHWSLILFTVSSIGVAALDMEVVWSND